MTNTIKVLGYDDLFLIKGREYYFSSFVHNPEYKGWIVMKGNMNKNNPNEKYGIAMSPRELKIIQKNCNLVNQ